MTALQVLQVLQIEIRNHARSTSPAPRLSREPRSPARCPKTEGTNSRTQERHSSTAEIPHTSTHLSHEQSNRFPEPDAGTALAKTHPHLTHEQVRTAGRRNGSRHTPSRGKTEGRRGEREFATKRPKRVSLQFTPADPDAPYYPNLLPASPPRGVGVSLVQLNTSSTVAPHNSKRACERGQKCNAHAVPGSVLPHSLNDESRSPLYNKGPLRNKKRRPQWERTLTEREVPRVCLCAKPGSL